MHDVYLLEEIEEWLPKLSELTGIVFPSQRINHNPKKYDYREFYNAKLKSLVEKRYEKDLEKFYPNFKF